jgi:hypothetical protein
MKPPRRVLAPLAILATLALASAPAHAGIGDMLKNKAKEAVTGKKGKPAAAAAAESGAIQSRLSPPMTAENVAKFRAAMEYELAEREKSAKFLKTVKPKDVYEKCKMDWLMSPAGQEVSTRMMSGIEGQSSEEMRAHMQKVGEEMEEVLAARCGPNPGKYNEHWAAQQSREALGRASDQFAKGDDHAYHIWKEWVTEFCDYIEKLKKEPDAEQKLAKIRDEGLRIPGVGTGIYFVYTASEANQLLETCDSLMPLIRATI